MSSAVFAVRGDSLNAWYSAGGKTGVTALGVTTTIATATDNSAINSSVILFSDANNTQKFLTWPGRLNTPNVPSISVMMRLRATYAGAPSARRSLLPTLSNGRGASIEVAHDVGSGSVIVSLSSESGSALNTNVIVGTTSFVGSTWYDVYYTWDTTNGANSFSVYVNNNIIGSLTPGGAFATAFSSTLFTEIQLGGGRLSNGVVRGAVGEIVVFDYIINSSLGFVGAARTAWYNAPSFDGSLYTSPNSDGTKIGTSFIFAGSTVLGTYDGSDRWSDPGAAKVIASTAYKANSVTNNQTGAYAPTIPATTKINVTYGASSAVQVGTYDGSDRWTDPGNGNVYIGTAYLTNGSSNIGTLTVASGAVTVAALASYLMDSTYIENSSTMRVSLRIMLSALAGKVSGAPSGPILIRDVNDTKNRITATVDANGNRTAVTLDGT